MKDEKTVSALRARNCVACDADAGQALFCPECGEPVPMPHPACPVCGHAPDATPAFCPECGVEMPVHL